jgi:hypothetical protein
MISVVAVATVVGCSGRASRPTTDLDTPAEPKAEITVQLPAAETWASATDRDEGPAPRCFAYSRSRRAYACVGWSAPEQEDQLGYVDIVGAAVVEEHLVWRRSTGAADREPVARRLAELGFSAELPRTMPLQPGQWMVVLGASIRYTVDLHEGDASYEYYGELAVRCADGRTQVIDVRKRGLELGERAVVSSTPSSKMLAVSIHGVDGGEGHDDHWINTVVIDPPALCRGSRSVFGPIDGRMVGP